MAKIGFSSDNHIDVNRLDPVAVSQYQADYLLEQHYDYYINVGDTFNDFEKTADYYKLLQHKVGDACHIFYIAGNHDLTKGINFEQQTLPELAQYIHHRIIPIGGTNTVIIGNNGWYDYSFADNMSNKTAADFQIWKRRFWIDGEIEQSITDQQRLDAVLQEMKADFTQAKAMGKAIVFVNHFIPIRDYIIYSRNMRFWNMANGLMGSPKIGDLCREYQVKYCVFGHMHTRQLPVLSEDVVYLHQPVGYGLKRINEWQSDDFLLEWTSTLENMTLLLEN